MVQDTGIAEGPDMASLAAYPLVFTLNFDIRCAGYNARVVIVDGTALMTFEDDAWWCHGVEPGGLTADGPTPPAAYSAFKQALREILEDLAYDAKNLEELEAAIKTFVGEADGHERSRWEEARSQIREGKGIEEEFAELKRRESDAVPSVEVRILDFSDGPEELHLAQSAQAA